MAQKPVTVLSREPTPQHLKHHTPPGCPTAGAQSDVPHAKTGQSITWSYPHLHWSFPHLRSSPPHRHYLVHAVASLTARWPCPTPNGSVPTNQVSDEHVTPPVQRPTLVPNSSRAIRRTTSFTLDCNQHSIASESCCKRTNLAIPANRARDCIASARAESQQRESTMREHESRKKRKNWTSPVVCVRQ